MEAAITPKVQAPGVCLWLPMVAERKKHGLRGLKRQSLSRSSEA